jgi:hypothetical protein
MYGLGAIEWKSDALWNWRQGRPLTWIDDCASELARSGPWSVEDPPLLDAAAKFTDHPASDRTC